MSAKKAIICGGSDFIDAVDLSFVRKRDDVLFLGCNGWAQKHYCDVTFVADCLLHPEFIPFIRSYTNKLAVMDYKLSEDNRKQADILFKNKQQLDNKYCGYLTVVKTIATACAHWACFQGCHDILLLGVSLTANHSKGWLNQAKNMFDEYDIRLINKTFKELKEKYNVNFWQPDKQANTDFNIVPYIEVNTFLNL